MIPPGERRQLVREFAANLAEMARGLSPGEILEGVLSTSPFAGLSSGASGPAGMVIEPAMLVGFIMGVAVGGSLDEERRAATIDAADDAVVAKTKVAEESITKFGRLIQLMQSLDARFGAETPDPKGQVH